MEISRWGDANNKNNAQFGIQPFYVPGKRSSVRSTCGNFNVFDALGIGTRELSGCPGNFHPCGMPVVAEHVFTAGVPSPGKETLQLLFYVIASEKYPLQTDNEVVIEKFEYLP